MWVRVVLLPFVWMFSVAATITRHIGQLIPFAKLHSYLFHYLVGGEQNALDVRDELIAQAESYLMETEAEIEQTPEELVREIEKSRERASTAISSGEFALVIAIGLLGFYVSEWYLLILSIVVALSASLRITAVDRLAISAPDATESPEWLMAALGWNRGAVEGGKILFNTASAVGLLELDELAFEAFVDEIFIPSLEQGGMSLPEAVRRFWPRIQNIVRKKMSG